MRDGDYYRWSYKDPSGYEPYWCASRIALVRDGRLVDTYWRSGDTSHAWSLSDAERLLDLKLVANLDDLEPCSKGVHEDHRPADIVDLTHQNGGQCYLRRGSERCMGVQRETWRRKLDAAQSTVDHYRYLLAASPPDDTPQVRQGRET